MGMRQKIRNSILAFIVGDALGVPFEFRAPGTFSCEGFVGGGSHGQPKGTWSDDSSILLCLLDSKGTVEKYTQNVTKWYTEGLFSASGNCFDIGRQTLSAMVEYNFNPVPAMSMGNGALFYSLPLAYLLLEEGNITLRRAVVESLVRTTHNNSECIEYSIRLEEYARNILKGTPKLEKVGKYENSGDVINTYKLVISNYQKLRDQNLSLLDKLCKVVNLGRDTDTNAALVGGLLGLTVEKIDTKLISNLRNLELIETVVDKFCNETNKQI